MNKDRLEEIENRFYKTGYETNTASSEPQQIHADLQYLIYTVKEQAEHAEKQVQRKSRALELINTLEDIYDRLESENKRYKQALEFYSKESNYSGYLTAGGWVKTSINDDNGEKARQALKE